MTTLFSVRTPLLFLALLGGCGEKGVDNNSEASCTDYCTKATDCADGEPDDAALEACVATCRDDIEDNCGNELQPDANDKIDECVDLACSDFYPCMVFEEAPQCFNFVEADRPVDEM